MNMFLVIALLLQLPAQSPKQDAPLSPAQLIEFRAKVEIGLQKSYSEIMPGVTVKVFIRSETEFMVVFEVKKTGAFLARLMNVKDIGDPQIVKTFVPTPEEKGENE